LAAATAPLLPSLLLLPPVLSLLPPPVLLLQLLFCWSSPVVLPVCLLQSMTA
jgi:hypothetical protein